MSLAEVAADLLLAHCDIVFTRHGRLLLEVVSQPGQETVSLTAAIRGGLPRVGPGCFG